MSLSFSGLTLIPDQDLREIDKMKFDFDLGTPFKPFEQLMGVLPLASKDHIPLAYQASPSPTHYGPEILTLYP